ncbi:UPF0481 protein [Camellia lanceoleosa]|uniref:UPF0481 protein n=1 Tax=Camellia lanceoleosa TaxID=1840588 RepID=A0ACC0HFI7_9ERIC|nr:UPF0481 protein [Camellia lanceoleosa]
MSETSADLVLDIDKKLDELPPIPSERCIFRVHDLLRKENEKAYEPNVVAIGPYHHGKDNLQPMEDHKLRYLQQLLQRRNETSAERYIVAMQESEQRARKFYAEPISLDSNAFVKMMVLDSCFIVELLRKYVRKSLRDPNDCIFLLDHIELGTRRDLMLFEKQLPFFIVMQLFNMTRDYSDRLDNLIGMFVIFFLQITPGKLLPAPSENPSEVFQHFLTDIIHLLAENPREDYIKHLLGLLHYCCCYEFQSMVSRRNIVEIKDKSLKSTKELQEAGIKFNQIEERNLFDIRFVNGTMEIPTLVVQDSTESFLRNLIAYELYLPDTSRNYFTAYHKVMDYLVNTSEDVEILTQHGIIHNILGDNEVVADMINKLGNSIVVSYVGYEEVYNNVNEHCRGKWNIWLAILRRKYFNNPWALISFLAAVVLLLLTVTNHI